MQKLLKQLVWIFFFSSLVQPMVYAEQNAVREEEKNFVSFFLGDTRVENTNLFTYAFEYYRAIAYPLGLSFEYERVPNNKEGFSENELFTLLFLHLPKSFYVAAGPGIKWVQEEPSTWLGRLSVGYIFSLPYAIEFIPNINFDLIAGQPSETVFGVSMGKRF